ncbi:MAG: glutamate-1-semialdehyde-2,1-aminomutase [Planctomycetes bacterium RBG_16_55_9]|nr:MAG: glutamate-1-semialdehyde-2,1-aminomutase [Planctomycetes bacterium RBG_16_55_9]
MIPLKKSRKQFRDAAKVIPGGVNSPVRAFRAVGTNPIFIDRAKGPYLYDADGNKYIDYCLSWGPMILGHARAEVLRYVKKVMTKGTSFGIPTELETRLAKMIVEAIGSVEKVRLVSSGTEAVMTAIRLARGCTGRDKIIKFIGCYHGHVDHLLVQAGSGATTLGAPSSPGVPKDFTKHTILLPYNDPERVQKAFDKYRDQIAAVIVEPIAGNMGVVPPRNDFLKTIRKSCTENGSLLIFDEVITGFRIKYGSVQDVMGVKADLTCLGKIIGGGFPIGACGGKAKLMNELAPTGRIYQAGTLSGNPVCVAAGIATLKRLKSEGLYPALDAATERLCNGIRSALLEHGIEHSINRIGSMFTVFFNTKPVTDYASATQCDTQMYARFHHSMLKERIYLPPSQFEACFVSTEHKQKDIDKTIMAARTVKR